MNTTNVFVELLVIGLGPVATALLILGIAFDPTAFRRAERARERDGATT